MIVVRISGLAAVIVAGLLHRDLWALPTRLALYGPNTFAHDIPVLGNMFKILAFGTLHSPGLSSITFW